MSIFNHIPHPHIENRKHDHLRMAAHLQACGGSIQKFNSSLAVKITDSVGTMWCAYLFALLALVSLPEAWKAGTGPLIAWIAQTFLQLVLLSIIIVGQKVAGFASDKRALDTYNDAEAVLHEAIQIQQHLKAQDAVLLKCIDKLEKFEGKNNVPSNNS